MADIILISPNDHNPAITDLIDLLVDSVDRGASVGFLPPLLPDDARSYWDNIFQELARGERDIWIALEAGQVIGSVQLAYGQKPNARHRAEVQKLLVHSQFRRQGVGRRLMETLEAHARQRGLALLVLDTLKGDAAEQLYPQLGFQRVGEIPAFARTGQGALEPTVVFYKRLDV